MKEREFKGVWIPKDVWFAKDLNAIDKVILIEIDSLDNENHCIAGNDYFANFCDVSEKTVSRSIQKLIKLGYITKISFNGRIRTLKSNLLFSKDKLSSQNKQNDNSETSNCPAINITNNLDNNKNDYKRKYIKEKSDYWTKIYNDRNFCNPLQYGYGLSDPNEPKLSDDEIF